jgi:cytoskeletal protein CcmA (bactofilin family)
MYNRNTGGVSAMASSGNTAESLSSTTKFTLGAGAAQVGVAKNTATIVGPEAVLRGDVRSKGDIVIVGSVEGEVVSEAKIIIASGGSVTGKVTALEVVLEGKLTGDSVATKGLSILSSAEVRGDVTTPVIMIEPGATFVGRCSMSEQPAAKAS